MEKNKIDRFIKLQSIQLEILKYFDKVAKQHNITYYLAFGTLLGAIRHQGFIPWDVDIDVTMKRQDYEKILDILLKEPENDFFVKRPGDKYHTSPHALLYMKNTQILRPHHQNNPKDKRPKEVYIDLFPIDNLSDDLKKRKKQIKKVGRLRKWIIIKNPKYFKSNKLYRFLKWARSLLFLFVSTEKMQIKCDKEMQKYNNVNTKFLGQLASSDYYRIALPETVFGEPVPKKFVDFEAPVPVGYDEFLTQVYGNYMELPSLENQKRYFDVIFEIKDNRDK